MTSINQVLNRKGREVFSIGPDESVLSAIELMAEKDVGSLVVIEDERPVGIFTERHYARNVFLKGKSSPTTPVREAMAVRPHFARPEQTVEECMAAMTENRVRHLPVLEGDCLVGIVSIGDLVESIVSGQRFTIQQLQSYIHG